MLLIDEAAECEHRMIMKDLCCDCGADLRRYVPATLTFIFLVKMAASECL